MVEVSPGSEEGKSFVISLINISGDIKTIEFVIENFSPDAEVQVEVTACLETGKMCFLQMFIFHQFAEYIFF